LLGLDQTDCKIKLIWSIVFDELRSYGERLLTSKGIGFADRVYELPNRLYDRKVPAWSDSLKIQANLVEIYSPSARDCWRTSERSSRGGEAELAAWLSSRCEC